jgi:hypothetical protein
LAFIGFQEELSKISNVRLQAHIVTSSSTRSYQFGFKMETEAAGKEPTKAYYKYVEESD